MGRPKKVKEEIKAEISPEARKEIDHQTHLAIINRIIEISGILDFCEVIIIPDRLHEYEYVDYADSFKSQTKPFTRSIETGVSTISCFMTQEQISQMMENWGIDVKPLVENALINEAALMLSKNVLNHVKEIANRTAVREHTKYEKLYIKWNNFLNRFRKNKKFYEKTYKVNSVKELLFLISGQSNEIGIKSKWNYGDFVICNVKTGAAFEHASQFTMAPMSQTTVKSTGVPYVFGTMAGMKFFVDPYMLISDSNIYIGSKSKPTYPGIKVFIYADGTKTMLLAEGTTAPKQILSLNYSVVSVGHSADLMYRKIKYRDNPENILL